MPETPTITLNAEDFQDWQKSKQVLHITVIRKGRKVNCLLEARIPPGDPSRGIELILTCARKNTDVVKRITASPWIPL